MKQHASTLRVAIAAYGKKDIQENVVKHVRKEIRASMLMIFIIVVKSSMYNVSEKNKNKNYITDLRCRKYQ